MARIPYNPHQVTRTERIAFRLPADRGEVLDLSARRKKRNPALLIHERVPMHYYQIRGQRDRKVLVVNQYVGDEIVKTPYEV